MCGIVLYIWYGIFIIKELKSFLIVLIFVMKKSLNKDASIRDETHGVRVGVTWRP